MYRKRTMLAGIVAICLGAIVSVNAQEYRSRGMSLTDKIRQAFGGSNSQTHGNHSAGRKMGTSSNYQNRHPNNGYQQPRSGGSSQHMGQMPDDLVVHERDSAAPTSASREPTPATSGPTPANRKTAFAEASDYRAEPTPAPRRSSYTPRAGSNVSSEPVKSSSSSSSRSTTTPTPAAASSRQLSAERRPTPAEEPQPVAATSPQAAGGGSSSRRAVEPTPQPQPQPQPQPVAAKPVQAAPQPKSAATSSRAVSRERDLFESRSSAKTDTSNDDLKPVAAQSAAKPTATKTQPGGVLIAHRLPVLSVETLGPQKIVLGREAHYKLKLENSGSEDAKDVALTVAIPSWAEVVGTRCSRGTTHVNSQPSGPSIEWQTASVAGGASETLELTLLPRASRAFDLQVQISSAPVMAHANVQVLEPKLQLAIAGPTEVAYGEKAVYRLTFSNPGTASAEDVKIRLFPVDDSRDVETYEIGTLPPGGKKVAEVELVARQRGDLLIRAQASALGDLSVDAQQAVLVRRPDVRIALEGPQFQFARTVGTFTIRVSNPGNDVARNVQVGAVLPRDSVYVSSNLSGKQSVEEKESRVRWILAALEPGAEQVLEARCELVSSGMNRLEAVCAAEGDLRDTASTTTEVEAVADLVLDLTDPSGPVAVGTELTYEVTVSNRGTKASDEVELVAKFADAIEPISVEGGRHTLAGSEIRLAPIPQVAAGEKVRIKIRAKAYRAGNHVVSVELKCPALGTRLSVQEATRFYGEDIEQPTRRSSNSRFFPTQDGSSQSSPTETSRYESAPAEPRRVVPSNGEPTPAAELSPIPAAEEMPTPAADPISREPTPSSRYGNGSGTSSRNQSSRYPDYDR